MSHAHPTSGLLLRGLMQITINDDMFRYAGITPHKDMIVGFNIDPLTTCSILKKTFEAKTQRATWTSGPE